MKKIIENDFKPIVYDTFVGKVIQMGSYSQGVIIPVNNLLYSGLKKGDKIKVYYKKVE